MNSGIYKLLFPSGKYYIGQTNNFKRRWEEHFEKMKRGKAARNMQAEYDKWGFPACDVLFECHPDHLNLMEPFFIEGANGPNMLNSSKPITGTAEELEILSNNEIALKSSTATICLALRQKHDECTKLFKELQSLKAGTIIPELEHEVNQAYNDITRYTNEIQRIKNLNLLDRIFKNY
jgi:hypothetical protein